MSRSNTLIDIFTRHKVACNLVMIMMILSGLWATTRINTQLDPTVEWPIILIEAQWPGASAEDVEQLIVVPIEQQVRTVTHLLEMHSTSVNGSARIQLEFSFDADMSRALDMVNDRIGQIRNLPPEMERVQARRGTSYENIATLIVSGGGSVAELAPLVRRFERELYAGGVDRIEFFGLPEAELAVQISSATLRELDTTLDDMASEIRQRSTDAPAGIVGRSQGEMQLRGLDQRRDVAAFEQMEISGSAGRLIRLSEIAHIEKRAKPDRPVLMRDGNPAIEMRLYRISDGDALDSAAALNSWLERTRADLPQGMEIHVYEEVWVLLKQQLDIIFKNAWSGLILVIFTLLLFLNGRVGGWVTIGIPVAFLFATLLYYALFAGSINILALITFIMALGIVVDDAIVVSEDAVTLYQQGLSAEDAATGAAKRMFMPVVTSSLTTLAAFVPLLIVGGDMGAVIQTMPMVLFCVIVASLIECFLVLPGHLKHSLAKMDRQHPGRFREWFDGKFFAFRERIYRPVLRTALANPGATLFTAVGCVVLAFSLSASGRVGINFVTGMSLQTIEANVGFSAEATEEDRRLFLQHVEEALLDTDANNGANNLNGYVLRFNTAFLEQENKRGAQFGSLRVEYAWEDVYTLSPAEFVDRWREKVYQPPFVEQLQLEVRGGANHGQPDLSLVLRGDDVSVLKQASEELQDALLAYEGVSNVFDNLPYGRDQIIFSLTPAGNALGLSTAELGRQLRGAYTGSRVQIFNQDSTEVEVVVTLPDAERDNLLYLNRFPIRTPAGDVVPLGQVADLSKRRGIDVINHNNGYMAVMVSASVDSRVSNADRVLNNVRANELVEIQQRHGLSSGLGGVSQRNQQLVETLALGAMLTLVFIYLILCWSFSSYIWPLAILTAIPLGMTGAIAGHWIMGMDIGAMSLLAFFALTGVVVNDSIVLISFFRRELESGKSIRDAIESAAVSRFRAVVLTSLTTVAGLSPLMFEKFSLAIYMVPIAITLVFGLAFATLLILLVIPAMIILIESGRTWMTMQWQRIFLSGRAAPEAQGRTEAEVRS